MPLLFAHRVRSDSYCNAVLFRHVYCYTILSIGRHVSHIRACPAASAPSKLYHGTLKNYRSSCIGESELSNVQCSLQMHV